MSWLSRILPRRTADSDVEKELRFHIEQQIDDYVRAGMSREEATRRTHLGFGGLQQVREECRDVFIVRWWDDLRRDVRLAIRGFRRSPVFFIVAVATLALGIGANTAIFSLVNGLVLRPLPVSQPEQLAIVTDVGGPGASTGNAAWTYPIWDQIRLRSRLFGGSLAYSPRRFNLASGGETDLVDGLWASGSFFGVLGVSPLLGRTFTEADDDRHGGPDGPVAVISYGFWQRRFGGATDVIGRTMNIERVPFTIVGVTSPDFSGPEVGHAVDVVLPLGDEPLVSGKETWLDERGTWWLTVMVRLRPDQSLSAAAAALRGIQPQIREATLPSNWPASFLASYLKESFTLVNARTGHSLLRRQYQQALLTILVVAGIVLLIACANLANLLLARAAERRDEWSARLALGASGWRLGRQLLTESLLVSAVGAMFGVLVARWGSQLVVSQLSSTQANTVVLDLSLDWRVLAFTVAATVLTAILFGTAPALRAAAVPPIDALKEHGRGSIGHVRQGLTGGLVVLQVALSLVLVVAAGLFVQTFASLATLHLGFDRDRVLLANVNTQRTQIAPSNRLDVWNRIRQRVRAVPGVSAAAVSFITPVTGVWNTKVEVSGGVPLSGRQQMSDFNAVTPGWFTALGMPILAGRDLNDRDRKHSPLVAVVNQAFAHHFLNDANPIGHTLIQNPASGTSQEGAREIVGVVADAVYRSVREPVPPTMYIPLAQFDDSGQLSPPSASVSVRAAAGAPMALTRSVVAAIVEEDPGLAVTVRPLADQVNASLTQERLVAMLSAFFGGLALLLAGLGLYGVTSYAVSCRRAEIGIRVALGAAPGGIIRLVLSRVLILVTVGVAVGALLSMWASRFVATLLFDLGPRDPTTLIGAALILLAVGMIAGWLPAHRAARLDPAVTLRSE